MKKIFSGPLAASVILVGVLVLIFAWNFKRTAPQREAHAIWHEHERVISDIAEGKRVDLEAFEEAVIFFWKLTRVTVPSNHSTFIYAMPTKETATALEPLRRWYAENKSRLYWDEERGEVRLAPE